MSDIISSDISNKEGKVGEVIFFTGTFGVIDPIHIKEVDRYIQELKEKYTQSQFEYIASMRNMTKAQARQNSEVAKKRRKMVDLQQCLEQAIRDREMLLP